MQLCPPNPSATARNTLQKWYFYRHAAAAAVPVSVPHASGDLFLGKYPSPAAARRAVEAVLPLLTRPNPWPAIWALQAAGVVAPGAYPDHIEAVVDDLGRVVYRGRQVVGGDEVETGRDFLHPGTAAAKLAVSVAARRKRLAAELAWVRKRFPRSAELPKYLRETKGGAVQARPWVEVLPGWSVGVNLGLYSPARFDYDRAAAIAFARAAWLAFVKMFSGPPKRDVLDVLEELKTTNYRGLPLVRRGVLPPCVKLVEGGYVGRVRRAGVVVWESAPHATVRGAWEGVKAWHRLRALPVRRQTAGGTAS